MKLRYIMLVGPPCCGKSTWVIKFLEDNPNTVVLSTDGILMEFAHEKDPEMTYAEAYGTISDKQIRLEFNRRKKEAEANKTSHIIFDMTNMRSKRRKKTLATVSGKDFIREAIIFPWDEAQFDERNSKRYAETKKFIPKKVWENFVDTYQSPTKEEGFDKITYLK